MGKSTSVTVGFKYYMSLHMGICRGPVDALLQINCDDDKVAWSGSATSDTGSFEIDQPDLFGGTDSEGGIDGTLEYYMGTKTQTISSKLKSFLEDLSGENTVPEFRGLATTYFDGEVCAMSPYPKKWAFRVLRLYKGWQDDNCWYSSKVSINMSSTDSDGNAYTVQAMNPAHIIYETVTNKTWGRGLDAATWIDDASWRTAADTLYDEGLGLCAKWSRTDSLANFVQDLLNHINGVLRFDKSSGKLVLKLLRADYDADTLDTFTLGNGIVSFDKVQSSTMYNLINEIIITYTNVATRSSDAVQRVTNLAGIQSSERMITQNTTYQYCPTAALASRLGERDLKQASAELISIEMTCDRRAEPVQVGDVIKISDTSTRGIKTMVLRISTVEESGLSDGKIKITGIQDMFAFALTSFTAIPTPVATRPDTTPVAGRHVLYEAPYPELVETLTRADFAQITKLEGYTHSQAEQAKGVCVGFKIASKAAGESTYTIRSAGDFAPVGTLSTALSYLTTVFTISNAVNLDEVEAGTVALIDAEFVKVVSISGTQVTIERGCYDTVPALHSVSAQVWFTTGNGGSDQKIYYGGESTSVKCLPYSLGSGAMSVDDVTADDLTFNFRFYRPFAPGFVQWSTTYLGLLRWYEGQSLTYENGPDDNTADTLTISWAHRNRVDQSNIVVSHDEASIDPEDGQTYVLTFLDASGNTVRTEEVSGTSYSYAYATARTDYDVDAATDDPVTGSVTLYSKRDGYTSWQGYTMHFSVYKPPVQNITVTSASEEVTQTSSTDSASGVMSALAAVEAAQVSDVDSASGVMAGLAAVVPTQLTKMIPAIDALIIERPYLLLLKDALSLTGSYLRALVAKPSDRISDSYNLFDTVHSGTYADHADNEAWTPWGLVSAAVGPLDSAITFSSSSFAQGIYPSIASVGQLLQVDNELMEISAVSNDGVSVLRGCADTIPAAHALGKSFGC